MIATTTDSSSMAQHLSADLAANSAGDVVALAVLLLPFIAAALAPLISRWAAKVTLLSYTFALIPAVMLFGVLHVAPLGGAAANLLTLTGTTGAPLIPQLIIPWLPSIDATFSFRFDPLAVFMTSIVLTLGTLIFWYAASYFRGEPRLGRFWATFLVFLGAMVCTVCSDNFYSFFLFWELTSICSFLLIGYNHQLRNARRAALQALIVTGLGGVLMLVGLTLLHAQFGVATFSGLNAALSTHNVSGAPDVAALFASPLVSLAFLFVLLGALTKSAQFPFQFWLPAAMAAPTPISAFLHSATMVKLGIFLIARLSPITDSIAWWDPTLIVIGSVTFVIGMLGALKVYDMKLSLAHTTVATLGALTLLLGVDAPYASGAAMLLILTHALYKGALFMVCGSVDHAVHSRDLSRLHNLGGRMPCTASAATIAALSMIGIVPTVGFLAKEYLYKALIPSDIKLPVSPAELVQLLPAVGLVVAFVASVLGVAVAFAVGIAPFIHRRDRPTPPDSLHESPAGLWLPPMICAVATIFAGINPTLLSQLIIPVASGMGSIDPPPFKIWSGFNMPLALSIATVLLGWGVYQYRLRPRFSSEKAPSPDTERSCAGQAPCIATSNQSEIPVIYSTYALLHPSRWGALSTTTCARLTLLAVASFLVYALSSIDWAPVAALLSSISLTAFPVDTTLVGFICVAALAALATNSQIAALAEVGIIGLAVVLLFVRYGAPDLALTTLLVETLSLIVFVAVLLLLPRSSPHRSGPSRHDSTATTVLDATIAVVAGASVTLMILTAQSGSPGSKLRDFFGAHSYIDANGKNVVNVILVDFRAFDTMGEITVLCLAALGITALLKGAIGSGKATQGKISASNSLHGETES